MSRLNLWLVRHGQTQINAGNWNAKPSETRLTKTGQKQAEQAALLVTEQPNLLMVSPLIRAQETAQFFVDRWPSTPVSIVPIQELIYLSPTRLAVLQKEEKREQIDAYWQKNDPYYCDGDDAESFAEFLQRVASFYQLIRQQEGYAVAIGHGQFFKAFQLGLEHGFTVSSDWMRLFREEETKNPLKNGEIVKLCFN